MNPSLSSGQNSSSDGAFWSLGFRPFFLLGSGAGITALWVWLLALQGRLSSAAAHFDTLWHAHEMIHGFFIAIIIGFLYTASQSWTQVRGVHGRPLQLIAALWLVGRVAFLLPGLHPLARAAIDLAFLPIGTSVLAPYLLRTGQRHNLFFLIALFFLWSSNVGYHLARQGLGIASAQAFLHFAVHLIIVMILVISSRVLPFFTQKAIAGYRKRDHPLLDRATFAAAGGFAFAQLTMGLNGIAAGFASFAAVLTLLRLILSLDRRIWRQPVLAILYLAYFWLVTGFALSCFAALGFLMPSLAIHAFTVGAISPAILGMISRVSLGHTGRPIETSFGISSSYVLLLLAALLRVFALWLVPSRSYEILIASSSLWILSFLIFILIFTPILLSPRADGKAA